MKNHHCQECDLKGYKLADTVGIGLYAKLVVCPSCFHKCPLCFGKGYQKKEDEEKREILSVCPNCLPIQKKISLFNQAQMPTRFREASLHTDNSNHPALATAYKKAIAFVKKPAKKEGLLFSGEIGCGKTTLVCALIKELILEKNEACFFIEFAELLGKVKELGYDNTLRIANKVFIIDKISSTNFCFDTIFTTRNYIFFNRFTSSTQTDFVVHSKFIRMEFFFTVITLVFAKLIFPPSSFL